MASLFAMIKSSALDNLVTEVKSENNNYILCGQCDVVNDEWILLATDGSNVWKNKCSKLNLEELIGPKSFHQFCDDFKNDVDNKKIKIRQDAEDIELTTSDEKITRKLNLVSENDRTSELTGLLFHLCNQVSHYREIANEKSRNISRKVDQLTSLDSHKKTTRMKLRHQEGMSLINPNCKKIKTKPGMLFDDSD